MADLYDIYVRADFDLEFWRRHVRRHPGPVLELMAGTGRVTEAVRDEGRKVVALELSLPMLRKLGEKIPAGGDPGPTLAVCADARALPFSAGSFGHAIVPFHSFAELVEAEDRRKALSEVARCLRPGGVFTCTLHNPSVRIESLDGEDRLRGRFPVPDARGLELEVWVLGERDPDSALARSYQRYRLRDERGRLLRELKQKLRFALVEPDEVERVAREAGLELEACFGDYDGAAYDPEGSPYAIQVFRKG